MARILIVDDDRSLTHLTKIILVDEGYEVAVAKDVNQAMEEIAKKKPDLILMDVVMPEVSGAEAVSMLQKKRHLKNIPIIFLTGLITNKELDLEEKGISVNGKIYQAIGKPFEISYLINAIKNKIES